MLGMSSVIGGTVGSGEYLIDFSKIKIAGFSKRALIAMILFFLVLGILAILLIIEGADIIRGLSTIIGCFSIALIYLWMFSWGRGYSRFRDVKFRLKYSVSVRDGVYILDLDLALLPVSIKPIVRVYISSGYSYALLRVRKVGSGVRVLYNGGILEFKRILEDKVYDGYSRRITIELKSLECTSHIKAGTFKFVSGSFIVVEVELERGLKSFAAAPIVFMPILDIGGEVAYSKDDITVKVTVNRKETIINAQLLRGKQYSNVRVGVLYSINATFREGKSFRKEIKIPLTKLKLTNGRAHVVLDFEKLAQKLVNKITFNPRKPLKPLIEPIPPITSYACSATGSNLRLPPPIKSLTRRGVSVKVLYYLDFKDKLRRRKTILIEAPLPPVIAKTL